MQKAGRRRRFRHPASHLLQALGRRLRAASCRQHHSRQQGIGFHPGSLGLGRPGLAKALDVDGIEALLVDNIDVRIWEKLVILSALSAITTLTRLPIGAILADERSRALFARRSTRLMP